MFMQRSHVPKIESRALHTYLQALVCPSKGTAVSVSTTGYEARLLCCVAQPLKLLWLGRVWELVKGVRVRAARKLLKSRNQSVSPIITCICQGLRIVPNVAAGCLSPIPLFTILNHIYHAISSVCLSLSRYVSQSVRTFRRPKGIIICQLAIVCYPLTDPPTHRFCRGGLVIAIHIWIYIWITVAGPNYNCNCGMLIAASRWPELLL